MSLQQLIVERIVDPIKRAQGSPASVARGSALGMWIALTPTVGIQMAIVAVLGLPLRANIPVALALVWISNPVTVPGLYFIFYWIGAALLGTSPESFSEMKGLFTGGFQSVMVGEVSVVDSLLVFGWDIVWPMCLGSLLLATVIAIPTYYIALAMAQSRKARILREEAEGKTVKGGEASVFTQKETKT